MIVVSSDTAVKDLLDKRSSIYSSRPEMFLGSTVASGGLRVVLMVSIEMSPCSCSWLTHNSNMENNGA